MLVILNGEELVKGHIEGGRGEAEGGKRSEEELVRAGRRSGVYLLLQAVRSMWQLLLLESCLSWGYPWPLVDINAPQGVISRYGAPNSPSLQSSPA